MESLYMQFDTDKECEEFLSHLFGEEEESLVREIINTIKISSPLHDLALYHDVVPKRILNRFLKNKGLHSVELLNSLEGKMGNWIVLNLDNKADTLKNKIYKLYEGNVASVNPHFKIDSMEYFESLAKSKQFTKANEVLNRLYSQNPWFFKNPENIEIGLEYADQCLNDGYLELSYRWYTQVLDANCENPAAYLGLGSIYAALGDLEQAMHYFLGGLDLNPGHVWLCYNACLILERIGESVFAIEEVEVALEANPDSSLLHKLAGDLYFKSTDNLEKALEHYKKAVFLFAECEPSDILIQLLNNYGIALAENGDLDVAERMLQESYILDKTNEDTVINLSAFYGFYKLEFESAAYYANEALLLNPDSGKAYHNLGLAFLEQGNWDRACFCLYKAKRLLPGGHSSLNNALCQLRAEKP